MFQSSLASKRRRDDSDDDEQDLQDWPIDKRQRVGSHRSIAPSLSIRPPELTVTPSIIFSSATLTPAHSDSGDSTHSPPPSAAWMNFAVDGDMDMDENDAPIASSPPLHSPMMSFSKPSKLNPHLFQQSVSGGRMPTPIHNTFGTHTLRPRNDTMFSIPEPVTPLVPPQVAKFPSVAQRMPSPISEDDSDLPTMQAESQLSQLSVEDMDGVEDTPAISPRKGRARSGAITSKKRFSMGFRDDCEKCKLKVPGHYAHFIGG